MHGERTSASRPGFRAGILAVVAGFRRVAKTPSLWPWALVPGLVLVVLEGVFITLAVTLGKPRVTALLPEATTEWGRIGVGAVGFLAVAVLAVAGWIVAVPLAPALSAPALEHVVERVERELGLPARAPLGFFRELVCGFRAMAGGLVVCLPLLAMLFALELVAPPLAVVTTPAKFVVSSLLVAWGLFDYPLTLRGVGFRERLALMRDHLAAALGFGLSFALVFWIPCCGVVLLPVGVAAAVELCAAITEQ